MKTFFNPNLTSRSSRFRGSLRERVLQCQKLTSRIVPFRRTIRERGIPILSNCHYSYFKLHRVQADWLETMKLRHSTIPAVSDNDICSPGPETRHLPQSQSSPSQEREAPFSGFASQMLRSPCPAQHSLRWAKRTKTPAPAGTK